MFPWVTFLFAFFSPSFSLVWYELNFLWLAFITSIFFLALKFDCPHDWTINAVSLTGSMYFILRTYFLRILSTYDYVWIGDFLLDVQMYQTSVGLCPLNYPPSAIHKVHKGTPYSFPRRQSNLGTVRWFYEQSTSTKNFCSVLYCLIVRRIHVQPIFSS